mgnify:CR=1 FL=1
MTPESLGFKQFFQEYEKITQDMDSVFQKIQADFPKEVRCHKGCSECCYALFDLTLVEALYINTKFHEMLSDQDQAAIRERADVADREIHKIKRRIYKSRQQGAATEDILQDVGRNKVRCPLLTEGDRCALYACRPVTCRVYGLPLSIGGVVHTCAQTGFQPGEKYPTIFWDKLQDRLLELSQRLATSIPTRYTQLGEVLVPLSMALLNEYDEEYLGLVQPKETAKPAGKSDTEWVLGPDGD